MKLLRAALLLAAIPLLAACSSASATAPAAEASAAPSAPASTPAPADSSLPDAPSPTGSAAAFAGLMQSLGFFPGTPAEYVDIDGNTICGEFQNQTYRQVISYEQSVDEGTLTGMTTDKDIATYVRDSVQAFCPRYAAQLPVQ